VQYPVSGLQIKVMTLIREVKNEDCFGVWTWPSVKERMLSSRLMLRRYINKSTHCRSFRNVKRQHVIQDEIFGRLANAVRIP